MLEPARTALVVVDMQRYYLDPEANFFRYFETARPGTMDYISRRCQEILPNQQRLVAGFRAAGARVVFLRLCGERPDRSDLHRNFLDVHRRALQRGFPDAYPLQDDPYSEVIGALAPAAGEPSFCKTTYSAFTTSGFGGWLAGSGLEVLVFAGLTTSQCVDTTARDAADRGYQVLLVEDALADYEETLHHAALYSAEPMIRLILGTDGVLGAI